MVTRARAGTVPVVRVETPYRDFLAFWSRAEHAPRDEQRRLWDDMYAGRHRTLFDHYLGLFGESASFDGALDRFGAVAGLLDARLAALQLDARADDVAELLDAPAPERAFAMVGLFTANAWSDDLEGEPTAFFALECLPHAGVVAAHEFAHATHRLARGEYWDVEPGLTLLAEGVAMATTRRLHPEAPPEVHFNVEAFAAWEAECDAAVAYAIDELLACLDATEMRQLQRFFWPDWGRDDRDVPPRIGYLLAARVMDALLGGHDLAEIARWPAERALPEVRAALETLAGR